MSWPEKFVHVLIKSEKKSRETPGLSDKLVKTGVHIDSWFLISCPFLQLPGLFSVDQCSGDIVLLWI